VPCGAGLVAGLYPVAGNLYPADAACFPRHPSRAMHTGYWAADCGEWVR
jgi:hypothetical protein